MNKLTFLQNIQVVSPRHRNGLILYKPYHAEFAVPGSAIGGVIDQDCQQILPVGNLALLSPESDEQRQSA